MIAHLIATGQIAPAIIALTLLEMGAIAGLRGRWRGGLSLAECLPNILAGDFLLLAWAFGATHWRVAAASLLAALLAHGTDMRRRWQPPKGKKAVLF